MALKLERPCWLHVLELGAPVLRAARQMTLELKLTSPKLVLELKVPLKLERPCWLYVVELGASVPRA